MGYSLLTRRRSAVLLDSESGPACQGCASWAISDRSTSISGTLVSSGRRVVVGTGAGPTFCFVTSFRPATNRGARAWLPLAHTPAVGEFREAMQQQHGGSAWDLIASFQYVHRQAIDVGDWA